MSEPVDSKPFTQADAVEIKRKLIDSMVRHAVDSACGKPLDAAWAQAVVNDLAQACANVNRQASPW